jgi:hypothetical protein
MCYGFGSQSMCRVDRCVVCCWMESIRARDEVHVITAIVEAICCQVSACARKSMRGLSAEWNVFIGVYVRSYRCDTSMLEQFDYKDMAECVPLAVHLLLRNVTP